MIIYTTFKDNFYTGLLEEYWDNFWFRTYYSSIKTIEDTHKQVEARLEAEHLLYEMFYNEDTATMHDIKIFLQIIKESIIAFVRNKVCEGELDDSEAFKIIQKLQVHIRMRISDNLDNDESVYYFLRNKQKIVM